MTEVSWLFMSFEQKLRKVLGELFPADCTFRVPDCNGIPVLIKCHKQILSAASPTFEGMFCSRNGFKEASCTVEQEIDLPDADAKNFQLFVDFIYYGTPVTDLNAEQLKALIYLGQKYLVTDLVNRCIDILKKKLKSISSQELITAFELAHFIDNAELKKKCTEIIKARVTYQVSNPDLSSLACKGFDFQTICAITSTATNSNSKTFASSSTTTNTPNIFAASATSPNSSGLFGGSSTTANPPGFSASVSTNSNSSVFSSNTGFGANPTSGFGSNSSFSGFGAVSSRTLTSPLSANLNFRTASVDARNTSSSSFSFSELIGTSATAKKVKTTEDEGSKTKEEDVLLNDIFLLVLYENMSELSACIFSELMKILKNTISEKGRFNFIEKYIEMNTEKETEPEQNSSEKDNANNSEKIAKSNVKKNNETVKENATSIEVEKEVEKSSEKVQDKSEDSVPIADKAIDIEIIGEGADNLKEQETKQTEAKTSEVTENPTVKCPEPKISLNKTMIDELLNLIDYNSMNAKDFCSGPGLSTLLEVDDKYLILSKICTGSDLSFKPPRVQIAARKKVKSKAVSIHN